MSFYAQGATSLTQRCGFRVPAAFHQLRILKLRDILGIESGTKADFIASDARARMPERHILRLSVTALDHRGMRARIS